MESNSIKIAPSILSADFSKLGEEIEKLNKSSCDYIHIDVMDGHFVPNLTFGPDIIKSIRPLTDKPLDVHLMINPVKKYINDYITAGANILTIHQEIDDNVLDCLKLIKKKKVKAGLSIKPNTSYETVKEYLDVVDLVLVMTVEPGFGGQSFLQSQVKKIRKVKELIGDRSIEIEVDGGINPKTAEQVIIAGAKVLVAGSAIFKNENYEENISKLKIF